MRSILGYILITILYSSMVHANECSSLFSNPVIHSRTKIETTKDVYDSFVQELELWRHQKQHAPSLALKTERNLFKKQVDVLLEFYAENTYQLLEIVKEYHLLTAENLNMITEQAASIVKALLNLRSEKFRENNWHKLAPYIKNDFIWKAEDFKLPSLIELMREKDRKLLHSQNVQSVLKRRLQLNILNANMANQFMSIYGGAEVTKKATVWSIFNHVRGKLRMGDYPFIINAHEFEIVQTEITVNILGFVYIFTELVGNVSDAYRRAGARFAVSPPVEIRNEKILNRDFIVFRLSNPAKESDIPFPIFSDKHFVGYSGKTDYSKQYGTQPSGIGIGMWMSYYTAKLFSQDIRIFFDSKTQEMITEYLIPVSPESNVEVQ